MKEMLYQLIETYDLIERTWEWFWKNYDSYLKEEPEESAKVGLYSRDSVEAYLIDRSYHISYDNEIEFIRITIDMRRKKDNHYIGYYSSDFTLNGEDFDDWFVMEPKSNCSKSISSSFPAVHLKRKLFPVTYTYIIHLFA